MFRVLLTGVCLTALPHAPALAQADGSNPQNPLQFCMQIQSDDARLACFDLVARGGEPSSTTTQSGSQSGEQTSSASPAGRADTMASAPGTDADAFGRPEPSSFSLNPFSGNSLGGGSNALADSTRSAGGDNSTPAVRILDEDRDGDPSKVSLLVERVQTIGYGTQRFHMSNGQIWEVTSGGSVRIPSGRDALRAEIQRGVVGGYLMRLNGNSRAVRVQRIDN